VHEGHTRDRGRTWEWHLVYIEGEGRAEALERHV
jgi:hypothetical protein